MPEMNTPGVFVEGTGPNPGPIQGVDTSTTAFVGPAAQGPVGVSGLLTSLGEFVAAYGAPASLTFPSSTQGGAAVTVPNYMALAARAFFENGGQRRLYVSRVAAADGSNNFVPTAADYRKALTMIEGARDVSIVAAPGSSVFGGSDGAVAAPAQAAAVIAELVAHVNQIRYRFAVLDTPPGYSSSDVQALRALIHSDNAALYYPWVTIASQLTGSRINVPPSGFVCGIYARSDSQQGVFKAPANLQIVGAVGLERSIADAESGTLNGLGINCLRLFAGKGYLVWGARTVSSDPEWKYVNIRRYMAYLQHSIDQGTQWVVFEPNGPSLWAAIKTAIQNFLMTEWRRGGLLGIKPEQAFFVKCDTTTMTQDDIDNGRLICLVGVALLKPAEFVIVRIGWQTDRKSG